MGYSVLRHCKLVKYLKSRRAGELYMDISGFPKIRTMMKLRFSEKSGAPLALEVPGKKPRKLVSWAPPPEPMWQAMRGGTA